MEEPVPLTELSSALAAAVATAAKSLVRIDARRRPATGVAWSQDTIVTASHVIEDEDDIEVTTADATTKATLVGRDEAADLAVVRVAGPLMPATWDDAPGLAVGHIILAVSRTTRVRASAGIVRAVGDAWRSPSGARIERFLESDIALHPGYSGCLLVSPEGKALGLNTSGLARGAALALPPQTLRRIVSSLLSHGHVRRGYLGIATFPVRAPGHGTGLLVTAVEPGSPADTAGLLLGDVVVAAANAPLGDVGDLLALLDEERIGKDLPLRVVRGGRVEDRPVKVGAR